MAHFPYFEGKCADFMLFFMQFAWKEVLFLPRQRFLSLFVRNIKRK